jgi:hypothetical protein
VDADGTARLAPLTIDFHEPALLAGAAADNADVQARGWYFARDGRARGARPDPSGPANPQALNRYSYVLNAPMGYTDPSGHVRLDQLTAKLLARRMQVWLDEAGQGVAGYRTWVMPTVTAIGSIEGLILGVLLGGSTGAVTFGTTSIPAAAILGPGGMVFGGLVATYQGNAVIAPVEEAMHDVDAMRQAIEWAIGYAENNLRLLDYTLDINITSGWWPGDYYFTLSILDSTGKVVHTELPMKIGAWSVIAVNYNSWM